MTSADFAAYGVDPQDYPNDQLILAIWPDRAGYYTDGGEKAGSPECRFCATVFNESDIFASASDCQSWLYKRLEVTLGGVS